MNPTVNDFWIAATASVLGGLAGYLASRFHSHFDLGRRRRAVATALLADLQTLEDALVMVDKYGDPEPVVASLPRMDVLARSSDYVDVLPSSAVRAIVAVNAHLGQVRGQLEILASVRRTGEAGPSSGPNWLTQVMTRVVLAAVDTAHNELIAAGGEPLPLSQDYHTRSVNVPRFPLELRAG